MGRTGCHQRVDSVAAYRGGFHGHRQTRRAVASESLPRQAAQACFVADTGLIAALPLSLSARPKPQSDCRRDQA